MKSFLWENTHFCPTCSAFHIAANIISLKRTLRLCKSITSIHFYASTWNIRHDLSNVIVKRKSKTKKKYLKNRITYRDIGDWNEYAIFALWRGKKHYPLSEIIFARPRYRNPLKLYRNPSIELADASHQRTQLCGRHRLRQDVRNGRREMWSFLFFQVSWVRHRDIHLLTVGVETYTSDQRFVASHFPHTEDWTLQVKYPQRRDSGTYECQVSTTPPIGHSMLLSVVG